MNQIIPKNPISIRPAVAGDLGFIDSLQRKHSKQVGWMQTMALQRKIETGEVLVASSSLLVASENAEAGLSLATSNQQLGTPIGYLIGQDRYFKRDDVGIIYQLNVSPGNQRGLVGASLLKAQFEKSAWGCKLYCCWCAQDIEANRFWEAMGFVALAFRAGSEKKSRVHIFWQRRIRSGDDVTPYWFPSQTNGGSIREDRLVLPIQPGEHWSEAKPMFLPAESAEDLGLRTERKKRLGGSRDPAKGPLAPTVRRVQFGRPSDKPEPVVEVKKEKPKKVKRKNDPKLVAAARELRDRWLEQVNAPGGPGGENLIAGSGKYDVSRAIAGPEVREGFFVENPQVKQIAA